MKLEVYKKRVLNIKTSHPADEKMTFSKRNSHYRAIIDQWFLQLSQEDQNLIKKETERFADKMSS